MQKKIGSLTVEYEFLNEGKGSELPLVVLLHGWGCTHSVYESISVVIAEKYTIVVPDLPGFGVTPEPPAAWSMDEYADFIADFIASFGAREVILVGHSFGGHLALKLAALRGFPFIITKLILVGSAGIIPKKTMRSRINSRFYKVGRGVLSVPPFKRMFPNAVENMFNKRASTDYKAASPLMRTIMKNRLSEDLRGIMPQITMPTLLVWGDMDTATPIEYARVMEDLIPDAGLATIKGAGHFCFLEQPVLFARIIRSFLKIGG